MQTSDNFSELINKRLPVEVQEILTLAAKTAKEQPCKLYMVGGMVRDLLLGRPSLDLDFVVEGDATEVARHIAEVVQGKVKIHLLRPVPRPIPGRVPFPQCKSEIF